MKKIVLLLFATVIALGTYSQINLGKLGTDILVDNSIKDGISIIESEYQLRDKNDGSLYGRGGKDAYGSVYNVGINTPMGVIATVNVMTPWASDPDFDKYRENEAYEPVLKTVKVFLKSVSDSVSCIELPSEAKVICNDDSTFFLLGNLNLNNNFIVQTESDIKDSWVIWFMVENGQKLLDFEKLKFNTAYHKQGQDINGKEVKIPFGNNTLLGGIILAPHITGIGKIELKLVGLIKKEPNKWGISSIPKEFLKNNQTSSVQTPETDNTAVDDDLTPVKSKSKKPAKAKSKKKK